MLRSINITGYIKGINITGDIKSINITGDTDVDYVSTLSRWLALLRKKHRRFDFTNMGYY
jgi:hypothetical protein